MIFAAGSALLGLSIPARSVFGDLEKALAIFTVTWLIFRASDVMGGLLADQYTWWGRPAASAVVPLGKVLPTPRRATSVWEEAAAACIAMASTADRSRPFCRRIASYRISGIQVLP